MTAFEIFGLEIAWYGIFYFVSFILGYAFLYFIKNKRYFAHYKNFQKLLDKGIDDLFIAIILGVLIGGRLGHVFIYNPTYFFQNPLEIVAFWNGGMAFIGGFIGVGIGLYIIKRKYKLLLKELLLLVDIILVVLPLGILLGRIGNFLNQELYGRPVNNVFTDISFSFQQYMESMSLFYVYENVDDKLRINSNFIEAFGQGFLLLIITNFLFWLRYIKNKIQPGIITSIFLIGYGIIRFLTEYIRAEEMVDIIGFLTSTQWFMLIFVVVCVYIFHLARKS